jgi:hypothetical protein
MIPPWLLVGLVGDENEHQLAAELLCRGVSAVPKIKSGDAGALPFCCEGAPTIIDMEPSVE